jgi:protein FAM32A
MAGDDYKIATGGALKLKGGNVVKKKKKKKPQHPDAGASSNDPSIAPDLSKEASTTQNPLKDTSNVPEIATADKQSVTPSAGPSDATIATSLRDEDERLHKEVEQEKTHGLFKTEAEKRFDEQRKKRLLERVKREGVKTHKERVEELNRYLSRQSEHHDMLVCIPLVQYHGIANGMIGQESDLAKEQSSKNSGLQGLGLGWKSNDESNRAYISQWTPLYRWILLHVYVTEPKVYISSISSSRSDSGAHAEASDKESFILD